jgi:hypothetical protein
MGGFCASRFRAANLAAHRVISVADPEADAHEGRQGSIASIEALDTL